MMLRQSNYIQ